MLLHRLMPEPAGAVDTADAYPLPDGTSPHLRVNMVSSADGAAAVEGRVGVLSGSADQVLLHELRARTDVLLVGAGTVRAEGYGPIRVAEEWRERRLAEGRVPEPRLAVLSGSLDLDLDAPVFTSATQRPLILTTERAPADRRRAADAVADVLVVGEVRVDPAAALEALAERGLPRVLSEGGPHVLAELFARGLVDELCLAVAPLVTCGTELRITAGPPLPHPARMRLAHVLEHEGYLFLRYTRP